MGDNGGAQSSHIAKQQTFFRQANALVIPSAPKNVKEVVKTSGYMLFFPISHVSKNWKNNDISWICDIIEPIGGRGDAAALNYCKNISTYNLECATLISSISQVSGTPSSLTERSGVTNKIISSQNYSTANELYKIEYGTNAVIPSGSYKYNPGQTQPPLDNNEPAPNVVTPPPTNSGPTATIAATPPATNSGSTATNTVPPVVAVTTTEASSTTIGVSAADSAKIKQNWHPNPGGKGKVELPVNYTWFFNTSIAEAIANVENVLPAYNGKSTSNQTPTYGTPIPDTPDEKNKKKYARIQKPWYFKSRLEITDKFVYASLDREVYKTYTDYDSVFSTDILYSDHVTKQIRASHGLPPVVPPTNSNNNSQNLDYVNGDTFRQLGSDTSSSESGANAGSYGPPSTFGYLGFPLVPHLNIPKVIPYLLYVPTGNGAYHLIVALKFVDPHFDPISLCKRIQQRLHERHGDYRKREDDFFERREMGMSSIPHLDDGFHNENRVYSEAGNQSLSDNPKLFFNYLCDYFAVSSDKERNQSSKAMASLRQKAMNMALDPAYDTYASSSHPLNLHTLFSLERAMNFLSKSSRGPTGTALMEKLSKIITQQGGGPSDDGLNHCPARLNVSYTIDISDHLTIGADYRFRCYRYEAEQFRWCYHDRFGGAKSTCGLVTQMMPHVHPVFQLDDQAFTEINQVQKNTIDTERQAVAVEMGSQPPTAIQQDEISDLSALAAMMDDEDDYVFSAGEMADALVSSSSSSSRQPTTSNVNASIKHMRAPAWTHLLDIQGICAQTEIRKMPNSKLPIGFDSFLVFMVLVDKLIIRPLEKIRPTMNLSISCINYLVDTLSFGDPHVPKSSEPAETTYFNTKIKLYVQRHNAYFDHFERHRVRILKFAMSYFFNPQIIRRVGKLLGEGWISIIDHYGDLLSKSKAFAGRITNLDQLRPSHYVTMVDGYTVRNRINPIDSIIGVFFEAQARRMYEQMDLYQNNTLFFVGILGCVMCVFRMDGRNKFNMLFVGTFAAGKSHLIQTIGPCCIKGFIFSLQSSTAQAFLATGLAADRLISCPEGWTLMETDPEQVKGALTDASLNKSLCFYDSKTGLRTRNDYFGAFYYAVVVGQNHVPRDKALSSRFFQPTATRDTKIIDKDDHDTNNIVEGRKKDDAFTKSSKNAYDEIWKYETYSKILPQTETKRRKVIAPRKPINISQDPVTTAAVDTIIDDLDREQPRTVADILMEDCSQDNENQSSSSQSSSQLVVPPPRTITNDDKDLFQIPPNPFGKSSNNAGEGSVHDAPHSTSAKHEAKKEIEEYWQHVQMILFFIHKQQAVDIIPQTSTDVWEMVLPGFVKQIEKMFPTNFSKNPRILDRIKTVALNVCEVDAIRRVFYNPTGPYYNVPFTADCARAVAPYLSITMDHVCLAISIANDEITEANVRGKIILAILKVSGFYQYCNRLREIGNHPPLGLETTLSKSTTAAELMAIKSVMTFQKKGIIINREFCEKTKFHDVHWMRAPKDNHEVNNGGVTNVSSSTNKPDKQGNKVDESDDDDGDSGSQPSTAAKPQPPGLLLGMKTTPKLPTGNGGQKNRKVGGVIDKDKEKEPTQSGLKPLLSRVDDADPKDFIDLNKVSLRIPMSARSTMSGDKHGMPKVWLDTLNTKLTNVGFSDVGSEIFYSEIYKMTTMHLSRSEPRFEAVSYDTFLDAVNGEKTILVSAQDNGAKTADERVILGLKGGNGNTLLSFDLNHLKPGKAELLINLDIQALQFLDGHQTIMNALVEVCKNFPLKKRRIPLLFHGPGAELASIRVGTNNIGVRSSDSSSMTAGIDDMDEVARTVTFQSKTLDPIRAVFDYNLAEEPESSGLSQRDIQKYDNARDRVQLSKMIDIDDYGRIIHITSCLIPIMRLNLDPVPGGPDKLTLDLVDYTKTPNDPTRVQRKELQYFFESTRKKILWDHFEPVRNRQEELLGSSQSDNTSGSKRTADSQVLSDSQLTKHHRRS